MFLNCGFAYPETKFTQFLTVQLLTQIISIMCARFVVIVYSSASTTVWVKQISSFVCIEFFYLVKGNF